jgi:hypothetical protein
VATVEVAAAERYVSELLTGREPDSAAHHKIAHGLLDGLVVRASLEAAPPHLAERLESLFSLDRASEARELRLLVVETLEVVEHRLPRVDTTAIRRSLGRRG